MSNRREIALISLASGTVSVIGYILLKKIFKGCEKKQQQEPSKIYEEKSLLDQYMLFNYAETPDFLLFDLKEFANVNNCVLFPKRVALLCRDYCPDIFFGDEVIINSLNSIS